MITEQQRKSIFYFCSKLGFDDDTRRTIQESVAGKSSLREFNDNEADMLLKTLREQMNVHNLSTSLRPGRRRNHLMHGENVHNLITPEQRSKIIAMSIQLYGKFNKDTMDIFCSRQFGKTFRLISSGEAIKLIEIQKAMLRRKHPSLAGTDASQKSNSPATVAPPYQGGVAEGRGGQEEK